MALPSILARGNNLDLLLKSEKEVFEIIESAVALADWRWPEELRRRLKPFHTKLVNSDSDSDENGYVTSAASNREIEVEDPTKQRRKIIRIKLQHSAGKRVSAIATAPQKPAQETEEDLRRHNTVTGSVEAVKMDVADSDFQKRTSSSVVRKRKLEEEEYEKKLENCKRKLREGYDQYTDSRKRSKVIAYIPPPESKHHHRVVSNQKKSKFLLTTARRR